MFDEPTTTSSGDPGFEDVSGSSEEISTPESSDKEEINSDSSSSDEVSSQETSSNEVSSEETSSEEDSSLPVSSNEISSLPIVGEIPPSQPPIEGTEDMQSYFTEIREHQTNLMQVASNLSVMSIVGIVLIGVIIGLGVIKLVRI